MNKELNEFLERYTPPRSIDGACRVGIANDCFCVVFVGVSYES